MKISLVLTLAGLSAAAPAIVTGSSDKIGESILLTPYLPELTPLPSDLDQIERRAESTEGAEFSDEEDVEGSATTTFVVEEQTTKSTTTSTRTLVSTYTDTQTQPAFTSTTTLTSVATTTETQTSVATVPAPTTTRTSVVTSTEATSKAAPTASATPDDSSDSEDEVDASLDADLEEFMNLGLYSRLAQEEAAPYPYERVFENQNATAIHQPIERHVNDDYDAEACAVHCNDHGACKSFAIFIERQPSCTNCSNPESTEANMCELYNVLLEHGIVTDEGSEQSIRDKTFTRAVRASNGYNKLGQASTVTSTAASTVTSTRGPVTTSTVYHNMTTTIVSTSHHTMSPITNTTSTVTQTTAAPDSTDTVSQTVTASPSASTVTETSTKTTLETTTETTAASPTSSAIYDGSSEEEEEEEEEFVQKPREEYWQ